MPAADAARTGARPGQDVVLAVAPPVLRPLPATTLTLAQLAEKQVKTHTLVSGVAHVPQLLHSDEELDAFLDVLGLEG